MHGFYHTSSKSWYSNLIFSVDYCSFSCYFYVVSVNDSFSLSSQSTFPVTKMNNFLIRVNDCSTTFWLACSCSRVFLSLAYCESMERNVLPILINCLWKYGSSWIKSSTNSISGYQDFVFQVPMWNPFQH
jgi:hypothetical protein